MNRKTVIAVTAGDPSGIGPEIAVRSIEHFSNLPDLEVRLYGAPDILEQARQRFAPRARFQIVECGEVFPFSELRPGELSARCGLTAYHSVCRATLDAIAGEVDAIVTAPVNKAAVNQAGIPFTGHTEMIAELCGTKDFAMMQSAGKLHVVFATTHIPLKDVVRNLSVERIAEVGSLLNHVLREEGIEKPKIAVAAINPHAGENGHMGMEEITMVIPAMKLLEEQGIDVTGPFPPDTLFIPQTLDRFDGVISMYHDQGHIPFKMLAFDRGVNSTLGIPIIRASVDHGTAFEIAWQGIADIGSMNAAFTLAMKRAANRLKRKD